MIFHRFQYYLHKVYVGNKQKFNEPCWKCILPFTFVYYKPDIKYDSTTGNEFLSSNTTQLSYLL